MLNTEHTAMTSHANNPPQPFAKSWEQVKNGAVSDPKAVRFVASIDHDRRLYAHDISGSIAHARMLEQVGLLSAQERNQIEQGLNQIKSQIEQQGNAWTGWRFELEDVHMCIEVALIDLIGEPGRKLHTGRSRNDQVALDLRLWIGEASQHLCSELKALCSTFVDLAEREGKLIMPSYTHLQRAQPILLGAELMAWVVALERAARRLQLLQQVDPDNPLGSGAIAGSALPLDRAETGRILRGSDWAPSENSIDSTATRDIAIDFVYSSAMIAMSLSRWAEQWIIYLTNEFGFLRLGDAYTTGSSMMPQKQNPDMLELIRGRCGTVYGHLVALLTICKGLPIGYNRDLQEDKPHLFGSFDTVLACIEVARGVIQTAHFNQEQINRSLADGFLDATSLADYLVTRGVPFRSAHEIVGRLVKMCRSEQKTALSELSLEQFNQACNGLAECDPEVYDWLGASNVAKRYATVGNAGFKGLQQQLANFKKRLAAWE